MTFSPVTHLQTVPGHLRGHLEPIAQGGHLGNERGCGGREDVAHFLLLGEFLCEDAVGDNRVLFRLGLVDVGLPGVLGPGGEAGGGPPGGSAG